MRFSNILCIATAFTSTLVSAAPTVQYSNAVDVAARDVPAFDFDLALRTVQELNDKAGTEAGLDKRDDDKITELLEKMESSNLLGSFVDLFTNDSRLFDQIAEEVSKTLSNADPETVLNALSSSPLASYFNSASKREDFNADDVLATLSKREGDFLTSIVQAIVNSGLVSKVVNSLLTNTSLLQAAGRLIVSVIKNVDWSSVFTAVKNSGLISSIFNGVIGLLTGSTSSNTTKREDFIPLEQYDLVMSSLSKREGELLTTIINFVTSLLQKINWSSVFSFIGNLLKNVNWSSVFSYIGSILKNVNWSSVFTTLVNIFKSLFPSSSTSTAAAATKRDDDWSEHFVAAGFSKRDGDLLSTILNWVISLIGKINWTSVFNFIGSLLKNVNWSSVFTTVVNILKGINWESVFTTISSIFKTATASS